jgi:hypothetical protein
MENMLEYCKLILGKVSFDTNLFDKEFIKAIKWLGETEKTELINWAKQMGFALPSMANWL